MYELNNRKTTPDTLFLNNARNVTQYCECDKMAIVASSQSSGVNYDYLFKVILIGDANVGKSSLISQFCNDKFMDTVASTVGVDFYIKDFDINEKKVKVRSSSLYARKE